MAEDSEFALQICKLCADIFTACVDECAKYDMEHCQECAEACRKCTIECRNMSAM